MTTTKKFIIGILLLLAGLATGAASAQGIGYTPPPYVLYDSTGNPFPTGSGTALNFMPPAFTCYTIVASAVVPCSFSGGGASTFSGLSGVATAAQLPAATTSAQGAVILPAGAASNTLGTAASQPIAAFDVAGAAAAAQAADTASASNASNLASGTVPAVRLPGAGVTTINGTTCTIGGSCSPAGSGGASVTIEQVFAAAQTVNFNHNLGTTNPVYSCYPQPGGAQTFTVAQVDANNVSLTTPAAADIVCSFTYAPSVVVVPPDFSFTTAPTSAALTLPMKTSIAPFTIAQTSVGHYSSVTAYSMTSSPSGITGVFSPTTITGYGSSTLSASIPYNQTPGTYSLTVSGTDGGTHTHTQTPSVVIATTNNGLTNGYRLDEGTGNTINDAIGTTNLTASGLTWVSGLATFNGALYGSGAQATSSGTPAFAYNAPWSVSFWVKLSTLTCSSGCQSTLVSNTTAISGSSGFEIDYPTTTKLEVALIGNLSTSNLIDIAATTAGLLPIGTNTMVTVTYDGSHTAAGFKVYINGSLTAMTVGSDTLTVATTPTFPFTIMASPKNTGGLYDDTPGTMQALRIYGRTLTSTEVSTLFAAGAI
jgi:hypothetical protein